jgi:hypothetical protein
MNCTDVSSLPRDFLPSAPDLPIKPLSQFVPQQPDQRSDSPSLNGRISPGIEGAEEENPEVEGAPAHPDNRDEAPLRPVKPTPTYPYKITSPAQLMIPAGHNTLKVMATALIVIGLILMLAAAVFPPLLLPLILGGAALLISGVSLHVMSPTIPLLKQWNANNGYCGECSTIAAGLTVGQYLSQYDVRAITAKKTPKKQPQTGVQFLLGENDAYAASQLHLKSSEWSRPKKAKVQDFLVWVKQMVSNGYPVLIGLYTNENLFYGDTDPDAGDGQYDHIVSVLKVESKYADGLYHGDDVITFSDHALWSPDPDAPQYVFSATFDEIQKTREEANDPDGPIYSLCSDSQVGNFGQAITGVVEDTLPISIVRDKNYESPEMVDKQNKRPAAFPLKLTVIVSKIQSGTKYRVYKYNDETKAFTPENAVSWFDVPVNAGTTYTFTDSIQSSDKAFYRTGIV